MPSLADLKTEVIKLADKHGFQQARVADIDTSIYFDKFQQWVAEGLHGSMSYLERNLELRQFPEQLQPETCRVISFRYNYLPENAGFADVLEDPNKANVSRYALGRDYHKLIRKKLQTIASSLNQLDDSLSFRVFVDSAPVMETSFAEKSGLGWKGKHTLTINEQAGSWFFLGEIFVNLPIEIDPPVVNQCGECNSCINLCPTGAIIAPYKVDARRCISYLTIENKQAIPVEFREQIGNRIYGCDDCQLACPWNRLASITKDLDFTPRHQLNNQSLINLFEWTEEEFELRLQGNPIRRIGYDSWLRNIAVALGNAPASVSIIEKLEYKLDKVPAMVAEHIEWALNQQNNRLNTKLKHSQSTKTTKLIRTVRKMLPRDA